MTTANKITIGRILFVPVFISAVIFYGRTELDGYRVMAILVFALTSISDAVDGYIARHYNQKSELGAILDPLADKLLLVSAGILLSIKQGDLPTIPPIFILTILSRDVLILLGFMVIHFICERVKVCPRWPGKIATFLQMVTIIFVLFSAEENYVKMLAYASVSFTILSTFYYVSDGVRQLNESPASAPTKK